MSHAHAYNKTHYKNTKKECKTIKQVQDTNRNYVEALGQHKHPSRCVLSTLV